MFSIGETVVHPDYGAGVIKEIKELTSLGDTKKRYYSIELLSEPETVVMVPLKRADELGLRPPISASELRRVWKVLRSDPKKLPPNYKKRCEVIEDRLSGGGLAKVAEVVRDLAWRREHERRLTVRGRHLYKEGIQRLASEVAGTEGTDFQTAESRIIDALAARAASATTA